MKMLSNIRNIDDLVLELLSLGYRRLPAREPWEETWQRRSAHPYFIAEQRGYALLSGYLVVAIYPLVKENEDDMCIGAHCNEAGELEYWTMFEAHGGSMFTFEPGAMRLHPESVKFALNRQWEVDSWIGVGDN